MGWVLGEGESRDELTVAVEEDWFERRHPFVVGLLVEGTFYTDPKGKRKIPS